MQLLLTVYVLVLGPSLLQLQELNVYQLLVRVYAAHVILQVQPSAKHA